MKFVGIRRFQFGDVVVPLLPVRARMRPCQDFSVSAEIVRHGCKSIALGRSSERRCAPDRAQSRPESLRKVYYRGCDLIDEVGESRQRDIRDYFDDFLVGQSSVPGGLEIRVIDLAFIHKDGPHQI